MDRILIRGVNWIGDSVMTLPAIRAIKGFYSDSEITLLVKDWVKDIFEYNPGINRILLYDEKFKGVTGKIKGARILKKYNFQKAFLLQNAFDAAVLSYLAGIPERIGYDRDGRGFLLSRAVPCSSELRKTHHILYYLELLKRAGVNVTYRHPWIYMSVDEREKALQKTEQLRRPLIVVNPGATYGSAKRWPSASFSELINKLLQRLDATVIIIGSEKERPISDEILKGIGHDWIETMRVINKTGKTSLRELIRLISASDVLVTNDSGPMHIGYALGVPVVALFGSTSPELTGPLSFVNPERYGFETDIEFSAGEMVLNKRLPCSPCFKRECPEGEPSCLQQILPDEVFNCIKELLPERKAVFFDRDGTLCHDPGYLNRWEDFRVYPEIRELKKLKEMGYLLIGVTNQSGIARGLVQREFVKEVNNTFIEKYGFDTFYYCPHHPDDMCACRKPSPGMLFKARAEFGINLRKSFVVGDKVSDMELAESVGAEGILIKTDSLYNYKNFKVCNSIKEAAEYIIERR
ncbi:MAG: lipopolysaccharide heptosyltransferase II [Nitrospirae bacterium]|nr:lipopolysaccharide heptosyltransferase II [Nitrospirota bacterium]